MTDKPQEWTNRRIAAYASNAPTAFEASHLYDAMVKVRDDMQTQLDAANARERDILRMFEDLTPGGSEFHNSPRRVADWIKDKISGRITAEIRHKREMDAANARVAELEQRADALAKVEVDNARLVARIAALNDDNAALRAQLARGAYPMPTVAGAQITAEWDTPQEDAAWKHLGEDDDE